MARRGPLTAGRRSTLDEDHRLSPHDRREAVEERSAVVHSLDVGKAYGSGVVVGVPVEVVGYRDCSRVPRRYGAAHTDAGLHGPVLERRDEVPGLTRDRDPPGRWIRRDDLRAELHGSRHHALPVRPGQENAELVGERDEVVLRAHAGLAGLAVARAREKCRAYTPSSARAQQVGVGSCRGADEHEIPWTVGQLVDAASRLDTEHRSGFEVRRRDLPAITTGEDVVQRDETELARMGRRAGDDHAARFEEGAERLVARAGTDCTAGR